MSVESFDKSQVADTAYATNAIELKEGAAANAAAKANATATAAASVIRISTSANPQKSGPPANDAYADFHKTHTPVIVQSGGTQPSASGKTSVAKRAGSVAQHTLGDIKQKDAHSGIPAPAGGAAPAPDGAGRAPITDLSDELGKLQGELDKQVEDDKVGGDTHPLITVLKVIAGLACPAVGLAYLLCEYPRNLAEREEMKKTFSDPAYAKFVNDRCDECLKKRNETYMDRLRRNLMLGMNDPVTRNGLANTRKFALEIWPQFKKLKKEAQETFLSLCDGSMSKHQIDSKNADHQAAQDLFQEMHLAFRLAGLGRRCQVDGAQQGVPVYGLETLRERRTEISGIEEEAKKQGALDAVSTRERGGDIDAQADAAKLKAISYAQERELSKAAQVRAGNLAAEAARQTGTKFVADLKVRAAKAGATAAAAVRNLFPPGDANEQAKAAGKAAVAEVIKEKGMGSLASEVWGKAATAARRADLAARAAQAGAHAAQALRNPRAAASPASADGDKKTASANTSILAADSKSAAAGATAADTKAASAARTAAERKTVAAAAGSNAAAAGSKASAVAGGILPPANDVKAYAAAARKAAMDLVRDEMLKQGQGDVKQTKEELAEIEAQAQIHGDNAATAARQKFEEDVTAEAIAAATTTAHASLNDAEDDMVDEARAAARRVIKKYPGMPPSFIQKVEELAKTAARKAAQETLAAADPDLQSSDPNLM